MASTHLCLPLTSNIEVYCPGEKAFVLKHVSYSTFVSDSVISTETVKKLMSNDSNIISDSWIKVKVRSNDGKEHTLSLKCVDMNMSNSQELDSEVISRAATIFGQPQSER